MENATPPDYVAIGFTQLERDLHFLIDCFAEVLRGLGEDELADWLPWKSQATERGPEELPPRLGLVYSVAFQLLNMVEENAAATMRELRETHDGPTAERGLWGQQLAKLLGDGVGPDEIISILRDVEVEPVLTAHPTEAKRLSVLEQHRVIHALLSGRGAAAQSPTRERTFRDDIKAALERLWRTGEILLEKPTVADERRNVLHYLRDVFPSVLPRLDERLRSAWAAMDLDPGMLASPSDLPRLRFGTWVGGDRDGHPGVTPAVTAETLERLRVNALVVHHRELTKLAAKLSLSGWMQPAPPALASFIEEQRSLLGDRSTKIRSTHHGEPWREAVHYMLARLPVQVTPGQLAQMREDDVSYRRAADLGADLAMLHDSLVEVGAVRLAQHDVAPVQRLLEVFGFHLARVDIRQNSVFHAKALTQLMAAAGIDASQWDEWSETERLRFLHRELRSPRPFLHASASAGPEADAVLACYRVVGQHLERWGADGLGSLIVSMTRRLSDLLTVYVLAREAGLLRLFPEGLVCLLPVVPLLETAADLELGPEIVKAFLEEPVTRQSIAFHAARAGRPNSLLQQVMVGYSDSNKDAGILASQWALQKAQSRLAMIGHEAGVRIQFFHGRGGTVSRGAGPTHRFLEALAPGSLGGAIRLTEQGETIAQKYGTPSTAAYNLELLVAGVTAATGHHRRAAGMPQPLAPLVERLAHRSHEVYRALLETDGFLEFHRAATPIDALEHARIGSRPARRTGQASLEDLRAIPWVFSWTQSRYYLTSWYGAGSALAALDHAQFETLREHLRAWPFLHYVITNIETSLASTDIDLMRAYAGLVDDSALRDRIWSLIESEWHQTRAMLERLRGGPMAGRRPRLARTLALRADALRLLHLQQIALLRRWRGFLAEGKTEDADRMLPELLLSINAIASGLRTTG